MEEILDAVNFEIQNSGFAEKLTAGVVITGGGAMLKNLPQLVKYKTAMDVRIGHPNVHLSGKGKDEINQPMYATSVGLILKGLEYIEENSVTVSMGERKQEPVVQHTPPPPPPPQQVKEPVREPEMAIEETQEQDVRRSPGGRFTDTMKKIWDDIIKVTDEKIDDNHSN
jgi:cell division protein FtsA